MHFPQLRSADIIEQEADGELLIYDLRRSRAYNLSETTTIIYRACGGAITYEELKRRYNYTDDLIHLALDELRKIDLIEGEKRTHFAGLTRREVIKRVGLGTMAALPVITALLAPTAAHAASTPVACNTACTCSAPNTDELTAFCRGDLGGTASGCTTQIAGCDCLVAAFSSAGTCEVFIIE